ncbi:M48 metallopeptidase family protein [Thalassotalea piscium]|uniref:YgjP-like metallopeptidase domain-containing protein n=1 Tax=Thalassotalea piscium TaxID=1230533 RepID=A0A7X0NFC2_9GAMM|nr:M48 family metallopeptidase [Thalassotalea piscium]MBB6542433.1 hypothetical protein [Thalassotalea piscium]
MTKLKYISSYSTEVQNQVELMLANNSLGKYLLSKYPKSHDVVNDKALRVFVMRLKNQHLKKAAPLSKVQFDDKIHVINNALGLHSVVSRVQGNKLKRKNEIRIATVFKSAPEEFLEMIVVHELAHLKEKEHNKAFYQLCQHMLPSYHQIELDLRLYLTQIDNIGQIYT